MKIWESEIHLVTNLIPKEGCRSSIFWLEIGSGGVFRSFSTVWTPVKECEEEGKLSEKEATHRYIYHRNKVIDIVVWEALYINHCQIEVPVCLQVRQPELDWSN